ncbi:MAG: AMP-binding protein, partial [Nitrospirota bacterium]
TCTIDRCFIAGLAYFSGIRGLGAAAIRNGLNNVESHLEVIQRLKPTAMVGVPTFLLKLGQYVQSQGLDPGSLGIRKMVCIGEPLRGQDLSFLKVGKALEEIWNADVYSTYASSEAITSFCECTSKQGGHLHPDLAVVEIIDDNGEVLPSGKTGEVVLTPLSIEGMPLVRFRTGDISFLIDEPCECGRNSVRLGPILGRRQQMIKFRGTTMYPGTLYAALDSIPQINEYFVVATCGYDLSDFISVHVSVNDSRLTTKEIEDKLQAVLRARPEVHIVSDDIIKKQLYAGNARKVTRFVDKRTNQ